ncbi:MAG TPA: S41 family peptidase, partial [Gammaproteobacteria bacterium]|nr:S41 family peptidase [Gammaproteobacteria bacterium]
PDGQRKRIWYRGGQAGFGDYAQLRVREPYRLGAAPPVAVLLGPGTASSAEVLAVAFRGRPHARSFGAPTAGLSAGNRTFVLADGASLVLTVAATADRTGRVYTDALEPEQPVETQPGRSRDAAAALDDAEVRAAAHWLAAEPACAAH